MVLNFNQKKYQSGISLIEVLVAVSIFGLVLVAVSHAITLYVDARLTTLTETKAIYLAEEGIELLKYIRDGDWSELESAPLNSPYYIASSTAALSLTATPETIPDGYTRSFIVRQVYRDGNEDIVPSTTPGATVATGTLSVVMRVHHEDSGTTSLEALLTNLLDL